SRFYSSTAGRFISEDSLALAAIDPNLYRYVRNAPLLLRDPYGRQASSGNFGPPVISGPGSTVNIPYNPAQPVPLTIGPTYPGVMTPDEFMEQWERMQRRLDCASGEICTA